MLFRILADIVVAVHLAFILFVVFGGLFAFRWRRLAWLHLPAAVWGALIELANWTCPLTPLENRLRRAAGEAGYEESFIEHYLIPLIYPAGLAREHQIALGVFVCAINAVIYWRLWRSRQQAKGRRQ